MSVTVSRIFNLSFRAVFALALLLIFNFQLSTAFAQGTAFTYQGQLNDGGNPANGIYDLRFGVYDAVTNGNAISGSLTNSALAVSNGLFTATLNFGPGIFTGTNYWLDIAVRATGMLNFTTLFPRQPLLPVPYAIFANTASNLSGTLPAKQLSGTLPASAFAGFTNTVALTNNGNFFGGTFLGNGGAITNVNVTHLTGVLADSQLPTNTAFLNSNQTFTANNLFTGANTFTNWTNSFVGSFFGNGLVGWIATNGTAVQAQIDTGYVFTNSQLATLTLPSSPKVGDIVRISGAGSGGWRIAQNAGQSVTGNFLGYSNAVWLPSGAPSAAWIAMACSADGTTTVAVVTNALFGVEISTNSGETWSASGTINNAWRSIASSSDGRRLIAGVGSASASGLIYVSTDSGGSWSPASGEPVAQWFSIAMSANGSNAVACAYGGGIYTSTSGGQNWIQRTVGLPGSANWQSVASSSDGSKLVAAIFGGGIYTSANFGATWAPSGAVGANWIAVASSSDGSKLVAAAFGGSIYTSANSGVTWTAQAGAPPVANWAYVTSSANGQQMAAVIYGGGIYTSDSFGGTWNQTSAPANNWITICSSADGSKFYAAVYNGTIYSSTSSTQTTTTPGVNGSLSGGLGSAVELQYIGNSQFMPVSSAGSIWAN
jgi:hypothetical protein